MPKGHNHPKTRRGTQRLTARLETPSRPTITAPRTIAAVRKHDSEESPPSTIVNYAAESTEEDDWVRRTPAAALILPPPKQFADSEEKTIPTPAPLASKTTSPPPRSHTAGSAMRASLSHNAANATRPSLSHTAEPAMRTSCLRAPLPSPPAPQPAIVPIVVTCLPDWVEHFKVIAAALGHTPNARAYGYGVVFEPKTTEEERTYLRHLTVAAVKDSAIEWNRRSPNSRENRKASIRRRPEPTAAPHHTTQHKVLEKPQTDAVPHEDLNTSAVQTLPTSAPRAPTTTETPPRSHTAKYAMRTSLSHTTANAMPPSLSLTTIPIETTQPQAGCEVVAPTAAPHTTQHKVPVKPHIDAVPHEDLSIPAVKTLSTPAPRAPTPTETSPRSHTATHAMRASLSHTTANAMPLSLSKPIETTQPQAGCEVAAPTAAPHTTQKEDAVQPQADAAPHGDLNMPTDQPAEIQLPIKAEATGREARRGIRRRRKRASRPPRMEPPVAPPHRNAMPPSPNSLELRIVRVVVEALTSGMAALRAKYMPEPKSYPWVQSQIWRTRAGETPAQRPAPGKQEFPAPHPGKEA